MKILVCVTSVPDTTTKITFTDNNTKLNKAGVTFITGPYDDYALARAVELKEQAGGTVTVLNVGGADAEPVIRKCLAIGADDAIRVNAEPTDAYFVAEQIAGLNPAIVADVNVPRITYCEPEVASVGLTEAKAVEQYGRDAVQAYDYSLAGNAKSEILDTSGSIKVVRVKDGPVVGVHGIGTRVGELIGEAQLVVNWEATPEDIAPYLHGHPTQYEALGEAFLALAGKPLHAL